MFDPACQALHACVFYVTYSAVRGNHNRVCAAQRSGEPLYKTQETKTAYQK